MLDSVSLDPISAQDAIYADRRRYQRVRVNLLGRYMLADQREFPCQVVEMSPGDMVLIAPQVAGIGERIVAYVDHLGRLEGAAARIFENGFAVRFASTERKRDKLASQLTWLANRDLLLEEDNRRHDRLTPMKNATTVVMPNGLHLTCEIRDASQSGAAIISTERPSPGLLVMIGKLQARVVRHVEDGFAVEFTRLQHMDFLEENLIAR